MKAEILTFKNIPYQIKLTNAHEEVRKQLPDISLSIVCLKHKKMMIMLFFLENGKSLVYVMENFLVMEEVYEEIIALYIQKVDWNN